ncbi:hypothetical protein N7470_000541 [Penicillium chermesinum]|nr:hypothetical protein N7470_000541 [Penicillium chermesinum]
MSTPNDLQALLASIRPRPSQTGASGQEPPVQHRLAQSYPTGMFPPHPQHPPPPYDGQVLPHPSVHGYRNPSVHSLQSPSPNPTPPRNPSDIISPAIGTPQNGWDSPQQPANVNLLNLLRFSQGEHPNQLKPARAPEQHTRTQQIQEDASHGRNISATDLVASLFGGTIPTPRAPAVVPAESPPISQEGPNDNTQDMLLRLLNRPQSGAGTPQALHQAPASRSVSSAASAEPKIQGHMHAESPEAPGIESEGPAKPETVAGQLSKDSMFTYVNPFDQLAAMQPNTSLQPQSSSASASQAPDVSFKQHIDVEADKPTSTSGVRAPGKRSKSPVLDSEQRAAVNDVVSRFVSEIGRSLSEESKPVQEEAPKAALPTQDSTDLFIEALDEALDVLEGRAKDESETKSPSQETGKAPVAAVTQIKNENAEALADSWESAEDSAEKEEERIVTVQNFPLRPFISIAVKLRPGKLATFNDDRIMDIARLKKDFDQLDRSLTAATSEYIVYALAKSGGIRIIRQEDGSDRQVFRSTRDRVFNVALSPSSAETGLPGMQALLGIGVSGTVYWTLISREGKDLFELDALESESLVFPPFPASDENTSGGQLKTRAKRSSRRADLFAIGRGKNIYVVSPLAAMNAQFGVSGPQRTVNTEKFFKERALKISTGKAGKDFTFSDDDTVIASLDKTGRLRFWDIRDVLDRDQPSLVEGPAPNEIKVPLSTYVTGSPTEKSWPTSVLFLDKLRPYSRANALRYVLVGLKQNHTLQLWDIGLGKAVEEVKFPHENESDAICSVAYHPASGIIVVGHPTRNSIYFVHLSAPRYNLPSMSQAAFIKASSDKESALPKPESTACLSGIREISFGSKGQLRSLEILPLAKSALEQPGSDDNALFELYVMHSRGVTCLNIKKEDMGWSTDNKVISPVDASVAIKEGWIEVAELQSHPTYVADDPSVNGDTTNSTPSRTNKEIPKRHDLPDPSTIVPSRNPSPTKAPAKKKLDAQVEISSTPSGAEKSDKKKKKKAVSDATSKSKEPTAVVGVEPLPSYTQSIDNMTGLSPRIPSIPAHAPAPAMSNASSGIRPPGANEPLDRALHSFARELHREMASQFASLHQQVDNERRSFEAAASARQDQVLRVVSETLSNNVELNLSLIIQRSMEQHVIPSLIETTKKELRGIVAQQIQQTVCEQLQKQLPKSIPRAFEEPDVMQPLGDGIVRAILPRIDKHTNKAAQSIVQPLLENMEKSTRKLESLITDSNASLMAAYDAKFEQQGAQLERIENRLHALTNALALGHPEQPAQQHPAPAVTVGRPAPEDVELQEIMRLYEAGRVEDAAVKWVQSTQQADLFDKFFVHVNPAHMRDLSAIVLLSVGAAVTATLATNTSQRLAWLELILHTVNPQDPEVQTVCPQIMEVLGGRLHNLYLAVVQENPQDPILRQLAPISRRVRALAQ